MSEVTSYLGLMPNGIFKEPKATTADGSASLWRDFACTETSMATGLSSEVFGSARSWNLCASKSCQNLDVMEAEKEGDQEHPVYDGLPIQYEDFFVLTLGLVDARPAYHDTDHIWPVGYRSCWHDMVTGSLFLCDVVDDGDTGPLFRVKRFSCSSLPIPYGSTVLYRKADEPKEVQTMESSPHNISNEICNETNSASQDSQDHVNDNPTVGDILFEFTVDGHSPSMVWSKVGERVADACHQIYKQRGIVKYEFLKTRNCGSLPPMVGNGLLLITAKNGLLGKSFASNDKGCQQGLASMVENHIERSRFPSSGKLLGSKLPPHLVGDVLQVWEELVRFHEILGLELAPPFDDLESELLSPWNESSKIKSVGPRDAIRQTTSSSVESDQHNEHSHVIMEMGKPREEVLVEVESSTNCRQASILLRKAQISLLTVLVSELKLKVAAVVDPTFDSRESKPKRGRKQDVQSLNLASRSRLSMLPINELTWPELARRYLLAVSCRDARDGNSESAEAAVRESSKIFRCLQGDGGVLCGSLPGVAGIEADALFLAEAMGRVYGSLNRGSDIIIIEDDDGEPGSGSGLGTLGISEDTMPEWAQELEPVRKLPTNVGTRIRKCVYAALGKGPPEWARQILEHSISKEVYKGNASGPTKKAVLSVLADVLSEGLQPKAHVERKKKTILSISDIIMKKCRIVLRHAVSADEDRVFCNLLGRSLMNSFENDDEGLLGSPATVSRPLDFRTIDFRLAIGAYYGSPEPFLEDVRELWNNVHSTYADQPDLVQVAETLSQNFESLYEKEVLSLLKSLKELSESELVGAEAWREILVSVSELPRAPWDEGVCKVCGIDKDDDAVLLCDTCDAEYHTYCLNPPLTRIPDGNWYCPSCVSARGVLKSSQVSGHLRRKSYHGEGMHRYLENLARLAKSMEEKDFWEFSVDERAALLKFLCDELLNSAPIRLHLEQCAEMSTDLLQKLRSLKSEEKLLKVREEVLATRVSQVGGSGLNICGESSFEEEVQGCGSASKHLMKPEFTKTSLVDSPIPDNGMSKTVQDGSFIPDELTKYETHLLLKKNLSCNGQLGDVDTIGVDSGGCHGNHPSNHISQKHIKIIGPNKSQSPSLPSHDINGIESETPLQGQTDETIERDTSSAHLSADSQGVSSPSDQGSIQVADGPSSLTLNESESVSSELNDTKKKLASLHQSIAEVELQLLNVSLRREFLGNDSSGSLYWISSGPGGHSMLISDRTIASERKNANVDQGSKGGSAFVYPPFPLSGYHGQDHSEGSKVSCPFVYAEGGAVPIQSQWVAYQSDAEISELIQWLKDNDPKEKDLKDSIVQLQKLKSFAFCRSGNRPKDAPLPRTQSKDEIDSGDCAAMKATSVLEKKYGARFESSAADDSKKRRTRAKASNIERMYRCKCLEPIWPSRFHCFHCHTSLLTAEDLENHSDGKCSASIDPENTKETGMSSGGVISKEERSNEAPKIAGSGLISNFAKFCSEDLSPFRFEEIRSKFVTNDSVKELVHGIGLISSCGTPSFISSMPAHVDDPALNLLSTSEDIMNKQSTASDTLASLQHDIIARKASDQGEEYSEKSTSRKLYQNSWTDSSFLGSPQRSGKRSSSNRYTYSLEISRHCTVPEASLRPLVGRSAQVLRQLKISVLDMEAALPEDALRPSKVNFERRCLWRAFVKRAVTIFEMIQAAIVMEDMIKTDYLKNEWWYWSSLSAAVKTATLSGLALRIHALDDAILYGKPLHHSQTTDAMETCDSDHQQSQSNPNSSDRSKLGRRSNKKRKEADD
ncbi:Methyl-CpG-binding domain-containing protein [Drosera capensis]